jgi:hypothetical protein
MENYLRSLRKQLKGFPANEEAALIEEIKSHIESGEADQRLGQEPEQRTNKLLNELGSPGEIGRGFRAIYRPNRVMDFLLCAIPYVLSLFLTAFYMGLRPRYPWMDIRINVIFALIFVAIGSWRRSVLVTLFWLNVAVMQLSYVVLQGVWQPYWYFGRQTIFWAVLLLGLLGLFGSIVWKNRRDPLIAVYALLPLVMEIIGSAVWSIQPVTYVYSPLDRSLLLVFLKIYSGDSSLYAKLAITALFFLPSNRNLRWLALLLSALMIGLGREYLFDYHTGAVAMVAQWIYYLYIIVPITMVFLGWWLDRNQRPHAQLPVSVLCP